MSEDKKKKVNKKKKATKAVRKLINDTEQKLKDTIKLARESVRLYKKELKRDPGRRPLKSVDEEAYNDWLNKHPKLKNHQSYFEERIKKASNFFQEYKKLREKDGKKYPARRAWKYIREAYLNGIDLDLTTFYAKIHKKKSTPTITIKKPSTSKKKKQEKSSESDKDYDSDEYKDIIKTARNVEVMGKESLYDIV